MVTLVFEQTYCYRNSTIGIEIPIELTLDGRTFVTLVAKVDTGASYCVFNRDIAEQLNIDVESGQPIRMDTAIGPFQAFGHRVKLRCFSWDFEAVIYFAEDPGYPRNVLGRSGWLDQFRLAIIEHDATLHLSRYDD